MGLLLVIMGGVFAALFILIGLVKAFAAQSRITFWDTLLAFLAALVTLTGLVESAMTAQPEPLPQQIALGIAAGLVVVGLLVMLLELRREQRLKGSRGVFAIGIGLLLAASAALIVPRMSERILLPVLATATPIRVAALEPSPTAPGPSATPTRTPSPTVSATPTLTRTPRPTATASPTRFVFLTRTPEPTPTLPNPCLARTVYNVNLRAEPSLDAAVVMTIPFDITVTLFGRTEDSLWWFGEYDDQAGWLKGEFLDLSASCAALPPR
ncbi:MAG: SH3 domain-containing protein [Anaerolineae bacterium]|nr:SH3 domain-containing protein [Anaerolineae bacterium]